MNFIKLFVPKTNELKEVNGIETWRVEWKSHSGKFASDLESHTVFFYEKNTAEEFKQALIQACNLLKYNFDYTVKLSKET